MKNTGKKIAKGAAVGARGVADIIILALKALATVLLIILTTGVLFMCIFAFYVKNYLASDLDVDLYDFSLNLTSTIYYENEETSSWDVLYSLHGSENRYWVEFEEIPEDMQHATVAIEDQRFYKHHGVDWYRTVAAFGNMFLEMKDTFGGSTITQQLIKNITQYDDVTVKRKLLEIFRALDFERKYSKEEIIEWYLNTSFFGEGCWGVGAAAIVYFDKDASELTLAECASIVGITNNPSLYDPYINKENNKKRQELILSQMLKQEYITLAEYEEAIAQPLVFKSGAADDDVTEGDATTWYVDALIEDVIGDLMKAKGISYETAETLLYTAGYSIYAVIDPEVQAIVDEIYSDRANLPTGYVQSETQELDSSIIIINQHTGDIVAMAGGLGIKEGSRIMNYATDMLRPPGSTIKPIASYGPAMEYGLIKPYTTFDDGKDVKLKGTNWYPNNDNYSFSGLVTVKSALQYSINTVAAQITDLLTPTLSYEFLTEKLGVTSLDPVQDVAYAPLALGQLTYGISPRELGAAYTALANNGIYNETRTYSHILDQKGNVVIDNQPDSNAAFSELTAYYMTDMLQNVVNSGTGYRARLSNMPVAGKTGASGNWSDRWFVGYTPYYLGVCWCGYETPEYMGSSNPSTTMWNLVMEKVHANYGYTEFPVPDNLVRVTVCIDSGMLASDACKNDVRGNHSMTLLVPISEAPTGYCDCHELIKVCGLSYGLPSEDCPGDEIIEVGMITLEDIRYQVLCPPYLDDDDKPINYIIEELKPCKDHRIDPATGWYIDPETGYLIHPRTGMLYDMVNKKVYDQYSGWEVDIKTGMLIHPDSGKLIDPWTGKEYIPDENAGQNQGNAIYTPDGFIEEEPEMTPSPTPTDAIPRPEDDPDYSPPPQTPEPSSVITSPTPTPGENNDPEATGSLWY